jgi:elongator complex protein 3
MNSKNKKKSKGKLITPLHRKHIEKKDQKCYASNKKNKNFDAFNKFSKKIISAIKSGEIKNKKELGDKKLFESGLLKLGKMPTNPFLLSKIKNPSDFEKTLLGIKPTRSLSGVQTIAVMLDAPECPGKCIYCPGALENNKSAKSYTGFEPSSLRARRLNFDSKKIVENRIVQLDATGNTASKIELIFQGSSFTALSEQKKVNAVKGAIEGVLGKKVNSFEEAKLLAEKSKKRIVGITFETRPDFCKEKDIQNMLELGCTRVELGVQNPDDKIYKKIKRGHSVKDVVDATARLKDSGLKICYHLMPGLPGSSFKKDITNFKKIFENESFKPDMVKIYPCLVIKGSELYEQWKKGKYIPLNEKTAAKIIVEIKKIVPRWVRIMRINRDIPSTVISAGIMKTNLRQIINEQMKKENSFCECIRCREVGLNPELYFAKNSNNKNNTNELLSPNSRIMHEKNENGFEVITYNASEGVEEFISVEEQGKLIGFVRLRVPSNYFSEKKSFIKEITNKTGLIRELHVYGKAIPVGEADSKSPQHKGVGVLLMKEAERIAKEKYGLEKMIVIAGIGVKEYYIQQLGYKKDGYYVSKKI